MINYSLKILVFSTLFCKLFIETKFNPGNDSQQLRDLTSKLKSKKRTSRRQTIVNAVSAQREVKPNSSNKSLTADGEKKKITLTDYKSRRSKTN